MSGWTIMRRTRRSKISRWRYKARGAEKYTRCGADKSSKAALKRQRTVENENGGEEMKAILSADKNWGIGYQNRLLTRIPSDMKFFRETTTGRVVVMGRKTLESFPNGLPLKNRTNIVLTGNKDYDVKDAVIVHSKEELLEELKKYSPDDIYVIGGESIYRMMLPYCDTVYVTKIDHAFQADTFFPNLDEMDEWVMTEESEEQTCFDLEFTFTKYERR